MPYKSIVAFLGLRGLDLDAMDETARDQILAMIVWGGEDEVGEKLSAVLDLGADGITCSLPGTGHIPERVEQLGSVASKVLGR